MAAKAPRKVVPLRNASVVEWYLPGFEDPFVQDPLTFFEKNDVFALFGKAIEQAVADGVGLESLLFLVGMGEDDVNKIQRGEFDLGMLPGTTDVVALLTRIMALAPGLLEDLYLVALSVPPQKRESVRDALRGMDDETGFGILDTFVEQNATTMRDFISHWRASATKVGAQLRTEENSPSDDSPTSTA